MQNIEEEIVRLRSWLITTSISYYVHMDSDIPDSYWDAEALRLVKLQEGGVSVGFYDEEFSDWDGSTGMHLIGVRV